MDLNWLKTFGAACGVIVGLSIGVPGAVEAFTGETTVTSFALGLGVAFTGPAIVALYLHQRAVAGRFGAAAFAVNMIGLGLFGGVAWALNMVLFYLPEATVESLRAGPTGKALLISAVVFVAGTVMFSVSMARSGALPKLPAIGYGLFLTLLALLAPLKDNPVTSVVHVLGGASLIWLSMAVLPSRRPAPHLVA